MISGMNTLVETISADMSRLTEDLLEDHSIRLFSRGGHFTKSQMIPVYFMLIYGCNEPDKYNNFLFSLREAVKNTTRPFAFIDTPLDEPNQAVVEQLSWIDRSVPGAVVSGLCSQINISGDPNRTALAQKALGDILTLSRTDVFDIGLSLAVKLNLIANAIDVGKSDEIPVIMYYGVPTAKDILFLCFAQRCGFDVICISSDKSVANAFALCPFADKIQKEELADDKPVMPFPTKMVKTKIATVAYNAERELDTMLYSGNTIFRDRQFDKMDSAVLKTTSDEINILWDQPAKYRSGFSVQGDRVIVPTIFAKINGVKDGDLKDYWDMVEEKLTPDSIYIIKSPSYKNPGLNVTRLYAPYHNGLKINIPALIRSPLNKYMYLSEPLQNLIFEKTQALLDDGLLTLDNPLENVDYTLYAALNMDKSVLRLLQKYDYTKEIPKFIVVDAIEEPFSKLECTQLLLFSYLGFDVLILSPSGYRDIEAYVSHDAFETHTFNEFKYNVTVPRFKIPTAPRVKKQNNGILKNLFKKGR